MSESLGYNLWVLFWEFRDFCYYPWVEQTQSHGCKSAFVTLWHPSIRAQRTRQAPHCPAQEPATDGLVSLRLGHLIILDLQIVYGF